MTDKILCVDDEQDILDGFQRQFRQQFTVTTRNGGIEALKAISTEGPFAVIVSDMQMPGMNGVRFLAKAKDLAPDSVRIMLTGMSDLQTAITAVNEGNIFRFLTKPCASAMLIKALEAGVTQYRLITAERELLENTLKGSIKVLMEVLALASPEAFSRALRIKHCVTQVVAAMNLPDAWRYDVAAMLSQLGCVTIPPDTLERLLKGEPLSESEQKMVDDHPGVARNLIANIPRLEAVAEMIGRQGWSQSNIQKLPNCTTDPACVGAFILKAATDYEGMLFSGIPGDRALEALHKRTGIYDPAVLNVLKSIELPTFEKTLRSVRIMDLRRGMILEEDVRNKAGVLIIAKGQEVTDTVRRRLENFLSQGGIADSVRVAST